MANLGAVGRKTSAVCASPFDVVAARSAAYNYVAGMAHFSANYLEGYRDQWCSISGVFLDEFGNPGQRRIHVYSRATGRLLAFTDSDPATGAYTARFRSNEEVKVTCQDDDAGALNNDLVLRTFPVAP